MKLTAEQRAHLSQKVMSALTDAPDLHALYLRSPEFHAFVRFTGNVAADLVEVSATHAEEALERRAVEYDSIMRGIPT